MTKKIYTYYDKLSVHRNASDDQIIDAYSELFKKYNSNKLDGDKKQQAERILAAITVAYENLIDPVKRTQHDEWIDKQDKDALSEISKAVEKTFSNVGNEIKNVASSVDLDAIGNQIKHIGENTEKKIGDIGDGLKNFAKNTGDKIDLENLSETAHQKVSDIEEGVKNFAKNASEKINFGIGENAKKKFNGVGDCFKKLTSVNIPNVKFRKFGLIFSVLIFGTWFYFTPHLALNSMRSAAKEGNATELSNYVDFPTLKENLKASLKTKMTADVSEKFDDNPFAQAGASLGASLALAIINPMIDTLVSQESLGMMIQGNKPRLKGDNSEHNSEETESSDIDTDMTYEDFNHFVITLNKKNIDEEPIELVFQRDGVFSWKLSDLRLPDISKSMLNSAKRKRLKSEAIQQLQNETFQKIEARRKMLN